MKTLSFISIVVITCSFLTVGCGKDEVSISDVITLQVPDSVEGNGTSIYTIKAFLDLSSDKSLRQIEFKTTGGSFVENKDTDPQKEIVTAKVINDTLFASVTWKVPATSNTVFISAEPVLEDKSGKFLVSKDVDVSLSKVASLSLSANEFAVYNYFESEVIITGLLRNNSGLGVSTGYQVEIKDVFKSTGESVNGRFRNENLVSNTSSEVSVIYSPGDVAGGQDILLIGTVSKQDGSNSNITDTLRLYVKQKN